MKNILKIATILACAVSLSGCLMAAAGAVGYAVGKNADDSSSSDRKLRNRVNALSDKARMGFRNGDKSTYWLVFCQGSELSDADAQNKCFQNSPDVKNNPLLKDASRDQLRAAYPTDKAKNKYAD